ATSSAMIGCMVGSLLIGRWLLDRLGRRVTLVIAGALFIVGAIWTAYPKSIGMFNLFRIVGGVGVGLASMASPMYINEIAPPQDRGKLGIMYQLAVCVGAA